MQIKTLLVSATLFFLLSVKTSYSENVAYIDIDFIMNNSLAGKSITDKLEISFKAKNEKFKSTEKQLKEREVKLVSQKNIINEEEYKKKAQNLMKEIKDYKENRQNFLNEFNSKKIESTKILLSKINPILADYSKEKSIDIIFQKKNIVIGKKSLDITKNIIDILNTKVKKIDID